jgi:hypothetical protein
MNPAANSEPSEIFALFDAILADGEVSSDELYSLAEWLNANPAACDLWPGNLLVEPLQAMWSDGKCGKMEIRAFVRLMGSIRREWNRRESERMKLEGIAQMNLQISSAARTFDPWKTNIPSIAIVIPRRSETDRSVTYQVDLSGPSCTCLDWTGKRYKSHPQTVQRCCKHILSAFASIAPEDGWPYWLDFISEGPFPVNPTAIAIIVAVNGAPALVSISKALPWSDVIAPDGDQYSRYGFNRVQDRWAYGDEPENADEIARQIRRYSI